MNVPTKPGFYRARVKCSPGDEDGMWMPVHVFIKDGCLHLRTTEHDDCYPVLELCEPRGIVLEWGSEIIVDQFTVLMEHLEAEFDRFAKDGVIGKFEGFPVSEKFTKKALLGLIVECRSWDRKYGHSPGSDLYPGGGRRWGQQGGRMRGNGCLDAESMASGG